MCTINRNYKDRLFRKLFGDPANKSSLLSLYNALMHTDHTNVDDLEINTIEDVIYMNMKNDVSCIIDDQMVLLEQQSTYNPNMPIRGLMYFSKLYEKYLAGNYAIYSSKLVKIPAPVYLVLYNGTANEPDMKVLHLHLLDASIGKMLEVNEWSAAMLNINYGHNKELLDSCKVLKDYSCFIHRIRENSKTESIREAIDKAVNDCIRDDILKEYLSSHKSEVIGMLFTEFDEKKYQEYLIKEAHEEGLQTGREEGLQAGREEGLQAGREEERMRAIRMMYTLGISTDVIAEKMQMTEEEVTRIIKTE